MTLIKSISGIRGTIGGESGYNLTPLDIVKFTSAYALWLNGRYNSGDQMPTVVVGRDARMSGEMVDRLVQGTLMGCGINIIDVGLCTTPGVEMAVTHYKAHGGIILTASHNEWNWNALKLLNSSGEFISAEDGEYILKMAEKGRFNYPAEAYCMGKVLMNESFDDQHINAVLSLPLVDVDAVRAKRYKVVVDGINSVGGVVMPKLLERMGVEVVCLNCEPTGDFVHNPEPVPGNMLDVAEAVVAEKADMGIVVDPDVDRLAFICEDGTMFGEEYTLVAVADYVLSKTPGSTVSNLSSTRALKDVTEKYGQEYHASAVGEVNVVEQMKRNRSVIGGEGNGGVIYPELHYGRDALVGTALFLSHLAKSGKTVSQLRDSYPQYHMIKEKLHLVASDRPAKILEGVAEMHKNDNVTLTDGVKIDYPYGWVHLRMSNTEPIIRIYAEGVNEGTAQELIRRISDDITTAARADIGQ